MSENGKMQQQTVLFVDDEHAVLEGLRRSLNRTPFRKLFAQSGFQALELVDKEKVDIVVADEMMPGMTGSDFLTIIRKRHPEIIRIILSGQASMNRVIAAINSGQIHRFLTKPIEAPLLQETLENYLSNLRLRETKLSLQKRTDTIGRWEWDVPSNVWQWNDTFCRIMHCSPQEGTSDLNALFASVHADDRTTLLNMLHASKDSDQTTETEHRIILPDGSIRWIAQYVDAFHDGNRAWKVFGMVRDITELKERESLQAERLVMLQNMLDKTVEALSRVTEIRDPYTAGHQDRVASLAVAVGRELGLNDKRLHGLETAAKLHDIGKIYVPAEILSKPGILRQAELELIKYHAEIGYSIVRDIPFEMPVAEIMYQHHERLDGSGYPRHLKGDAILLEARILGVVDVFEAMSSHRPYRPGLGIDGALAELRSNQGTHYDPTIIDALAATLRNDPDLDQEHGPD